MKVLLDTNIILDIILHREPFFQSAIEILRKSDTGAISSYITANSITDIYYVLRKYFSDSESRKKAIQYILNMIDIVGITKNDAVRALESDFNDLEDALQAQCAKKIKADYIVTRNIRDFVNSPVKAILPERFLELHDV